jgi:hypothetical protein
MIKSIEEKPKKGIEIDLTGPDGNAWVLLGLARSWSKQIGLDSKAVEREMMSGDYENLLQVMDKYFGSFVTFYR